MFGRDEPTDEGKSAGCIPHSWYRIAPFTRTNHTRTSQANNFCINSMIHILLVVGRSPTGQRIIHWAVPFRFEMTSRTQYICLDQPLYEAIVRMQLRYLQWDTLSMARNWMLNAWHFWLPYLPTVLFPEPLIYVHLTLNPLAR